MTERSQSVRDQVEVELIRSLFATWLPSAIMSVGFLASAFVICTLLGRPELVLLGLAGAFFTFVRMAFLFLTLRIGLACEEEAELLAKRLSRLICAPFQVGDYAVQVTTSIGYVTSGDRDVTLDQLLGWADEALYVAKRSESSLARYRPQPLLIAGTMVA